MRTLRVIALAAAMTVASVAVHAAMPLVTDAMTENDAKSPNDVLTRGMGTQGQRFSTLTKISTENVSQFMPAWSSSFGGEKQCGQEFQSLIYNGKMSVTASYSRIYAIGLKTDRRLWKHEQRLLEGIMPCCDVVNRGVALYDNLAIFSTLSAQLIALNQDTGKIVWKDRIEDYAAGYSTTAAPPIVKGMVLTGVSGGEFGVVGRVEACDARTGQLIQSRPTVEGHMGRKYNKDGSKTENGMTDTLNASWPGETRKTDGASTWLGGTYDPQINLVYFGTGNPEPWNSHPRGGDNPHSSSTLAINPGTGKIAWHYQNTPSDGWDLDGVNKFVTSDMDGKRVGGKADRNGFFYVNDTKTGKLLSTFPFMKVNWATSIDLKIGRPNYAPDHRPGDPTQAVGEEKKGKSVFAEPGFLGGRNQMPMAYSPQAGLFYVPANEWGMDIWNEPMSYKKGATYLGAGSTIKPLNEDYIDTLRAINPKAGKMEWQIKNNVLLWGGVMIAAGGLVFQGTPEGYLKAADAKIGKELWQFQTGNDIVTPPVTWGDNGEQFVAVVPDWGGAVSLRGSEVAKRVNFLGQGGSVWVFKLHKN